MKVFVTWTVLYTGLKKRMLLILIVTCNNYKHKIPLAIIVNGSTSMLFPIILSQII